MASTPITSARAAAQHPISAIGYLLSEIRFPITDIEIASRPVSRVLSGGCPPRRSFVWDATCAAPRATNPSGGLNQLRSIRLPGPARPLLFGLAPGEVCRAVPVARNAVVSYTAVSPLPGRNRAVCSLWHCLWGRPRRPLAATVRPWSPDFPPPPLKLAPRSNSDRPADWHPDMWQVSARGQAGPGSVAKTARPAGGPPHRRNWLSHDCT